MGSVELLGILLHIQSMRCTEGDTQALEELLLCVHEKFLYFCLLLTARVECLQLIHGNGVRDRERDKNNKTDETTLLGYDLLIVLNSW